MHRHSMVNVTNVAERDIGQSTVKSRTIEEAETITTEEAEEDSNQSFQALATTVENKDTRKRTAGH